MINPLKTKRKLLYL